MTIQVQITKLSLKGHAAEADNNRQGGYVTRDSGHGTGQVRLILTRLIRSCHLIRSLISQLFTFFVYFNCFNCLFYVVIRIST